MTESIVVYHSSAAIAAFSGIVANGYIIFILLCCSVSSNSFLLFHLAIVDIIFCISALVVPFKSATLSNVDHESICDSDLLCIIQGASWTAFPILISLTVCGLSLDRYAKIVTPLSYSRLVNKTKMINYIFIIWIISFGLCIPPMLGVCAYTKSSSVSLCFTKCTLASNFEYIYALIYAFAVLLPIVTILVCNFHIIMIARKHRHRILMSALYEVTLHAQATITHQSIYPSTVIASRSLFKGRDALVTVSQLVGSLLFLHVPYLVAFLCETFAGKAINESIAFHMWNVSMLFVSMMPVVNAYIYGVKSKMLRKAFKHLLQRYIYKQQASQEIDRRMSLRSQSSLKGVSIATTNSMTLNRYKRRHSAPLNLTYGFSSTWSVANDNFHPKYQHQFRRQSLNLEGLYIESENSESSVTRRPNFLTVDSIPSNKNKPLSPIQEISFSGNNENSSTVDEQRHESIGHINTKALVHQ